MPMPDFRQEIRRRLAQLKVAPAREHDIVEELALHVETRYHDLLGRGLPDDEARRQALEEMDGRGLLAAEMARAIPAAPPALTLGEPTRGSWLGQLGQDLRFGARMLLRYRGFTTVAALTLALGIGANTAIFTLVNAVMLRPLPFADASRLYNVYESNPGKGWDTFSVSHPTYLDWRHSSKTLEDLAAWTGGAFSLSGDGETEVVSGLSVTANFFPNLRVTPILGRDFTAEEDRPGGPPVVLIGEGMWQRRFGGDRQILGRTLTVNDEPRTIVGVVPASFDWSSTQLYLPLAPDPNRNRSDHRLTAIARLAPGVAIEQARAEMNQIAAEIATAYPESNKGWSTRLTSFYDDMVPEAPRKMLLLLLAAAGLVLLIAASNVANLTLARASSRQKEITLRVALGAGRGRIVRQLVTESVLLSLLAGAVSIAVAYGTTALFKANAPSLPRMTEISVDARVIGFALLLSTLTGVVFGLVPALQATRLDVHTALQQGGRGATSVRRTLRSLLVVVEVALSVALLAGAGLLIRSFWTLNQQSPGFHPDRLLSLRLAPSRVKYPDPPSTRALYPRIRDELRGLPGVSEVVFTSIVPMDDGNTATSLQVVGRPPAADGSEPSAAWRLVSPDYFKALRIPLRGREFAPSDADDATRPVIISEDTARRLWPGEDALGKQLVVNSFDDKPRTVIGVAGDVRSFGLDEEAPAMVYGNAMHFAVWRPMYLVVRTVAEPTASVAALRAGIARVDPNLPVANVRTLDEIVSSSIGPRRFNMFVLGVFAAVALALACVGLFGVLGYLVTQRTREIGVRMALGAPPGRIFRLIVGEGMALVAAGALVGVGLAVALTRVMASLLYQVEPTDPLALGAAVVVLLAVAALACYLPARRAMRTDPMAALRYE